MGGSSARAGCDRPPPRGRPDVWAYAIDPDVGFRLARRGDLDVQVTLAVDPEERGACLDAVDVGVEAAEEDHIRWPARRGVPCARVTNLRTELLERLAADADLWPSVLQAIDERVAAVESAGRARDAST